MATTGSEFAVGAATLYSASSTSLRLNDGTSDCTGTTFAVNYNGTSFGSAYVNTSWAVGNTVDLASMTRYIKLPYTNAAKTNPSLTATFTNSTSSCTASQIVITNASGTVLNVASACVSSTQTTLSATDTTTVGSSGAFYVFFTRAGDASGGIRVWQLDYSY